MALLPLIIAPRVDASNQDADSAPLIAGSADVLSVAGSLVLVIALIFLASFLYSRLKTSHIGGRDVINIVASRAIGPRERIVLVEIANTQLVVGLTTSHVQTLHVFDEPVVKAAEPTNNISFADRLKLALRGDRK